MLTIRLQRTGKKNRPEFRVVVTTKTAAPKKKFLEVLASFNPRTKALLVKDKERVEYWLGQNVQLSPTVHNLFVTNGLLSKPKVKAFTLPKKAPEVAKPESVEKKEEEKSEPVTESAPTEVQNQELNTTSEGE